MKVPAIVSCISIAKHKVVDYSFNGRREEMLEASKK